MPNNNTANLQVLANNQLAGQLLKEQQQYVFHYDQAATANNFISLTMPVRARSYEHPQLLPIFDMHLPEGYLLAVIQRHFAKVIGNDALSILGLLAPGIRGRLQYQKNQPNAWNQPDSITLDSLLDPPDNLFEELIERFALSSAVSGVQPKVLAQVIDKASLRLEDYIVKTWGDDYPQLALNEYWCMKVAAAAGIPVPDFYLSTDARFFIIKRFDITPDGYLGFEDAGVLQGKTSQDKYTGSYEQLAKTINNFVSPEHKLAAMQQFFKMLVINTKLQNGDAHLKNFGLLYSSVSDIWLAPAYDIISTTAYIKNDTMALTLLGSRKWWSNKHLLQFARQHCLMTLQQAEHAYAECEQALLTTAHELENELNKSPTVEQRIILEHLLKLSQPASPIV